MTTARARVAVVGGGLAGITAALACADAGQEVVLLEARPRLGGLTASFRRGDLDVDTGQHVFLRCCTAYLGLLDRLGVRDRVHVQPRLDIPVRTPGQAAPARIRRNRAPAPLHLAGALARYSVLSPLDRLRVVAGALALRRVGRDLPATDAQSFGNWLAATVFQEGLLTDAAAADIGWSLVPLGELHGTAAARALAAAGVEVRTSARALELSPGAGGWVVGARGRGGADRLPVDGVVLAVPPSPAEELLPAGALDIPPGWAARLGSAPIVNVHVVFDRPVLEEPFVAGVETPVQWVFDRTRQSGLADGQYLAVSLSAAQAVVDRPAADVLAEIVPALRALLPGAADAEVRDAFVTRERAATFDPRPGSAADRPGPRSRAEALVVAGAWTATGWPATMEGAVRSGVAAAHALLTELAGPSVHQGGPVRQGSAAREGSAVREGHAA
jgi:monoamine oxidase